MIFTALTYAKKPINPEDIVYEKIFLVRQCIPCTHIIE